MIQPEAEPVTILNQITITHGLDGEGDEVIGVAILDEKNSVSTLLGLLDFAKQRIFVEWLARGD